MKRNIQSIGNTMLSIISSTVVVLPFMIFLKWEVVILLLQFCHLSSFTRLEQPEFFYSWHKNSDK